MLSLAQAMCEILIDRVRHFVNSALSSSLNATQKKKHIFTCLLSRSIIYTYVHIQGGDALKQKSKMVNNNGGFQLKK